MKLKKIKSQHLLIFLIGMLTGCCLGAVLINSENDRSLRIREILENDSYNVDDKVAVINSVCMQLDGKNIDEILSLAIYHPDSLVRFAAVKKIHFLEFGDSVTGADYAGYIRILLEKEEDDTLIYELLMYVQHSDLSCGERLEIVENLLNRKILNYGDVMTSMSILFDYENPLCKASDVEFWLEDSIAFISLEPKEQERILCRIYDGVECEYFN